MAKNKCGYKAVKHAGYAVIVYGKKRPKIVTTTTSFKWAKEQAKELALKGKDAYVLKQMGTYKHCR